MILIRSVHERNILNLTKEIKNKQLEDARAQHEVLVESSTNVQNRIDYYNNLIEQGLSSSELLQLTLKGSDFLPYVGKVAKYFPYASLLFLLPQVGSPFAMTFGGKQTGSSVMAFLYGLDFSAKFLQIMSESAGIKANFERREQEWEHQKKLAEQEKVQMEKQIKAAEIRIEIAEKEIEIHDKNIEQTNELDEFYKNKFTNLGLYSYLSTSMFRLYREAYNLAFDMSKKTEKAYQFEVEDTDDTTEFIAQNNWQFDRAGLLAGERLILQLQSLENAFVENNGRQNEITQSFSLALLDPRALTDFKENAECEFKIPEIMFDSVYPGQYRRIIKSVRITMPCVTGPYTNIGINLRLMTSKIRYKVEGTTTKLEDSNNNPVKSISTSSAQNDTGLFEFAFRDERYLPFEGAGAVESQWKLELPDALRLFDYNTISDVILHISYTSKEDGAYRERVQKEIVDQLKELSSEIGLLRLTSLKHDFPAALNKLLNPDAGQNQITEFVLSKNYFPYFLAKQDLDLREVTVYLKPKGEDPIKTSDPTLSLKIFIGLENPTAVTFESWDILKGKNLKGESKVVAGNPVTKWTIDAGKDRFKKDDLDDIIILMDYKTK